MPGMGRPNSNARRTALRSFFAQHKDGLRSVNNWAKTAGISEGTIRNFLAPHNPTEGLNDSTYQALAEAASKLLQRSIPVAELRGETMIPGEIAISGFVGAGGKVDYSADLSRGAGLGHVPAPPIFDSAIEAVIVRGDSMFPVYRDGDILYFSVDQEYDPTTLVGQDCIVKISDGGHFIKVLKRGTAKKAWTLGSWNNPDIENVRLDWVRPVLWVMRAKR